jgi:hypothetical protein
MTYSFSFGRFKDKTFEWCFFKAPWYVRWIYENGIYRQRHLFDEDEAAHFLELYRHASDLAVTCEQCNQPATRMGLTFLASGSLGSVGFFCDECEYPTTTDCTEDDHQRDSPALHPWKPHAGKDGGVPSQ